MSLITGATSAAATTPAVSFLNHGRKKGAHSADDTNGPSTVKSRASTQGLLSSLLQSVEQVIGFAVTTAAEAASVAVPGVSAAGAGIAAAAATLGAAPVSDAGTASKAALPSSLGNYLQNAQRAAGSVPTAGGRFNANV